MVCAHDEGPSSNLFFLGLYWTRQGGAITGFAACGSALHNITQRAACLYCGIVLYTQRAFRRPPGSLAGFRPSLSLV